MFDGFGLGERKMSTPNPENSGKLSGTGIGVMNQTRPRPKTTATEPTYKPIVRLIHHDRNAIAILGKVCQALSDAGLHREAERYMAEATSGDYHNLLRVTMDYVEIE